MNIGPEAETAIAALLSLCKPSGKVAQAFIEVIGCRKAAERVCEEAEITRQPLQVQGRYGDALRREAAALHRFMALKPANLRELCLKLALVAVHSQHGQPSYADEAFYARLPGEIVAATKQA